MGFHRLSFTERRRRRLAKKVDRLDHWKQGTRLPNQFPLPAFWSQRSPDWFGLGSCILTAAATRLAG